jgi:hypothetical protein
MELSSASVARALHRLGLDMPSESARDSAPIVLCSERLDVEPLLVLGLHAHILRAIQHHRHEPVQDAPQRMLLRQGTETKLDSATSCID